MHQQQQYAAQQQEEANSKKKHCSQQLQLYVASEEVPHSIASSPLLTTSQL